MRTLNKVELSQATGGFVRVIPGPIREINFINSGGDRLAAFFNNTRPLTAAEQAIVDADPVQERAIRAGVPLF